MRRRAAGASAFLALAAAAVLQCVAGAGVFELQVLEFSNYRLGTARGACCGGAPAAPTCARPCPTRFALCLKEYQAAASTSASGAGGASAPGGAACSFGYAESPVLGTDSFTLADPVYTLALNFTFRWTRSFTLILQAFDDYNYTDPSLGLIEEAAWSGIVEPGGAWHVLRHAGPAAAMAYRVRVACARNYHGPTCTAFCRARDDKFGHYACDELGLKRCLSGWQGDNCETPICKEGCHPIHGRCDKPGDCDCRPGWRGPTCSSCTPYPGCKRGYCNGSSWDCTCDTNWGGILCDQDLNYCGTHEPCRHGGTCENTAPDQYLCNCAEGFSGNDCERVDNPCAPAPCAHGECELRPGSPRGFSCTCEHGWEGALCERDVDDCAARPCVHGTCRDLHDAYACDCSPGWTGPTCEEDVDECAQGPGALGPCVNAQRCNNTVGSYACACLAGWSGRDCDANVDDCAGQCLHGATCIDLVDDYHCACAPGWAGRTCARDVDDCASRPCRNGGDCVDLLDAYRCICPVGYTGLDCEDKSDHCASAPCGNQAQCYTAQDDYYCHCARGWTGKNCTQPSHKSDECADHCGSGGSCSDGVCQCRPGWTGRSCDHEIDECASNPCRNNGTCLDKLADFTCICPEGWTGRTCSTPADGVIARCDIDMCVHGACAGGSCVCRAGWGGAHCERALEGCAAAPCRHGGVCSGGAGWWQCACAPGWGGPTCEEPLCARGCPSPSRCARDASGDERCVCPDAPATVAGRCRELLEESVSSEVALAVETESSPADGDEGARCAGVGAANGTWWWGCNACWCAGGAAACTRLWCGLPDCLARAALPCRADEVCVPSAGALCLRAPCAALGECRRVAGRRVEPPALPAPPACWPGSRTPAPPGCARARLLLARERLARGAHVERACWALRRALASALAASLAPAALAQPAPPLTLLCDQAADDDDALDLALWVGEEEGGALAAAVRALSELVSRRRLPHHALLAAALRLQLSPAPAPAARSAAPAPALLALAAVAPLLLLGAAGGAALWLRRRRRAAELSRRCDEEKSNNLQNEENLRRYANPLRGDAPALHKAHNADARNTQPAPSKELCKRPLPPPRPPPERLTVVV